MRRNLFGPFARDEMLMLPGFDDVTPVCPAEAFDGTREWVPAAQIPEFKEIFLDAAAPDDAPSAAAFKGAALQKALAMGVPPTAYMISESRKRIADLEKALKSELERREKRDAQFEAMLQSVQELAGSMSAAVERLDEIGKAITDLKGAAAPKEPEKTPEPPAPPGEETVIGGPPLEGPAVEVKAAEEAPPAASASPEPEMPVLDLDSVPEVETPLETLPEDAAPAPEIEIPAPEAEPPLETPAEDAAPAPEMAIPAPEAEPPLETPAEDAAPAPETEIPAPEAEPPLETPAEDAAVLDLDAAAETPVFESPQDPAQPDLPPAEPPAEEAAELVEAEAPAGLEPPTLDIEASADDEAAIPDPASIESDSPAGAEPKVLDLDAAGDAGGELAPPDLETPEPPSEAEPIEDMMAPPEEDPPPS